MKHTLHPLETFYLARSDRNSCLFCEPIPGMILRETENFRLLVDTFPIASGHVMITTKAHYGCAGEIEEDLQAELFELKSYVKSKVNSLYGYSIFYESGRAGGCSYLDDKNGYCEHFHLHCLPVNVNISNELSRRFRKIELQDYREISTLFFERGDYLYFEDAEGRMQFFQTEGKSVESHLLRTLICRSLGAPELADWELFNDPTRFLKSYEYVTHLMHFQEEEEVYDLFG